MKFSLFFLIAILVNILKSEAPSLQKLKATYIILKYNVKIKHYSLQDLQFKFDKKRDETKLN